jgi:hypothetical protein
LTQVAKCILSSLSSRTVGAAPLVNDVRDRRNVRLPHVTPPLATVVVPPDQECVWTMHATVTAAAHSLATADPVLDERRRLIEQFGDFQCGPLCVLTG